MIVGAFGLRKDPFRITPDPQFFFAGAKMRPALEELAAALLGRRGLVLVLGDSGTGKTTLLRKMEADLEAAGSIAIIVTQPRTGIDDILHRWAEKLGIEAEPGGRAAMVAAIRARQRAAGRDALAVILVDEADHCSEPLLRDLIALGVPAQDGGDGLQSVLAGQKVLEARLSLELPDVHRRVAAVTHLERLSHDDVDAYVRHRLRLAGYVGPELFPEQLVDRIAQLTDGVPRLINHLCGRALALASQAGESVVLTETLDEAARDCMLLEGQATASRPIVAEQPAAPRRPMLAERFAAQKSTAAAPPRTSELDIPSLTTGEAAVASRAKAKLEVASPRARPDKGAAASAASADSASAPAAEATSVEIPKPPVAKEPATRSSRNQPVGRTPPEARQAEPSDESSSEIPIVTLVAPPAEPADTSAAIPEEMIPAGAEESAIPPARGAEAETVLELALSAMVNNEETAVAAAPASERASAELPVAARTEAPDGLPAQALARHAVDESSPGEGERYVPISRAAVSKLVGRRRIRLPSEGSSVASTPPSPEGPLAPPSPPPPAPAFQPPTASVAEPAPAAISSELEPRRRRSMIETSEHRHEPVVVRSSGWLRRAALLGVLVVGAGAGAYAYYFWSSDAPGLPKTTASDAAAPATAPAMPPPTLAPATPPQGRGAATPTGVAGDSEPKAPEDLPTARAEEEGSQERPALPVPKILRLPVIDPRQSSPAGAASSPRDVSPIERSPSGSSSIDAPPASTVAALSTPLAQTWVRSGDAVVIADSATPSVSPLPQAPPETGADSDWPSIAVAAPPPAGDLAPKPPEAPIDAGASATRLATAAAIETSIERPAPQTQESSHAPATIRQDSEPTAAPRMSDALQGAVPPPAPPAARSDAMAPVRGSQSAPPTGSTSPSTGSASVPDSPDARIAEPATAGGTAVPAESKVDAPPPVQPSAALSVAEPLVGRADVRPQGASAESPPPALAPSGAVPTDVAPIRMAEPTRAAAVAVPSSPPAGGIRLTQGGGGVNAEQLIARGDIYMRDGDIASARLLFEAAARLGNAAAARRIGTTYDPIEHRRLRIVGVSPNAQIALDWYRQAMDANDGEARRRHAELSAWMARGGAR